MATEPSGFTTVKFYQPGNITRDQRSSGHINNLSSIDGSTTALNFLKSSSILQKMQIYIKYKYLKHEIYLP